MTLRRHTRRGPCVFPAWRHWLSPGTDPSRLDLGVYRSSRFNAPFTTRSRVGSFDIQTESPIMPEQKTIERARRDKRAGKAPTTQAGEFVHEEIEHIRQGRHGARSTKQAIAIGLSKARRAGVALPPPPASAKSTTKRSAQSARRAAGRSRKTSRKRSRAIASALKREGRSAASRKALSLQAKTAARRRSSSARSASARRAARTKGPRVRKAAARRAAQTRQRRRRAGA